MTRLERRAEPSWRDVLDETDAAALRGYARPRGPYGGSAPLLLVVDVTESFVGPDLPVLEAQAVSRQACGLRAWRALPQIAALVDGFRSKGLPLVFTMPDPHHSWVGAATRGNTRESDSPTGIVETIRPRDEETVVVKAKASAFFGTPLLSGLIKNGLDTIVLAGGTTSGCIRATAVDGTSYGFEVLVAEDACFDRVRLSHLVALCDIDTKYGRVHPTAEILELIAR